MPIDFNELLFADDTLLFAAYGHSTEALLQSVGEISARYGLLPNKDKCALLEFGLPGKVQYADGQEIPAPDSTVYCHEVA